MLTKMSYLFGIVFLTLGILGFIPALVPGGMLFGIFSINAADNIFRLVIGVLALWVGYASGAYPRLFFQVFGIFAGVAAVLGFWYGSEAILEIFANNYAGAIFRTVVSVIALYLGFMYETETSEV